MYTLSNIQQKHIDKQHESMFNSKYQIIIRIAIRKEKGVGTLTVAEPLILKNVDYNVIFLSNFPF